MELRTLDPPELDAWLDLLDGWPLPEGIAGRDFFRRPVEVDPDFSVDDVWVAVDGAQVVASVQLFPRRMRLLGHSVPCGGIGSVFTHAARRREGLAAALLARALTALVARGFELSLLFAGPRNRAFYERAGFAAWQSGGAWVAPRDAGDGRAAAGASGEGSDLDLAELDAVAAIHSGYSAVRSGTFVRDALGWQTSLALGAVRGESFRTARRAGRPVAYLRSERIDGVCVATELGRVEDTPEALAELVAEALARDGGTGIALPAFDDLALTLALEGAGLACTPLHHERAMLRCLDGAALGRRLDVGLLPGETDAALLARLLPHDGFVSWPADRF